MNIPDKIQIAGVTYHVKFHDKPLPKAQRGHETVAQVNIKESIIDIHTDIGSQAVDTSFLHEVQHAIFFAMGYSGKPELVLNEAFVERSAQLWNQVIQQIIEYNQKHD